MSHSITFEFKSPQTPPHEEADLFVRVDREDGAIEQALAWCPILVTWADVTEIVAGSYEWVHEIAAKHSEYLASREQGLDDELAERRTEQFIEDDIA